MRRGVTTGFFQEARVSLEEEDVEEKVEGEGPKIYECGEETPVLLAEELVGWSKFG